MAMNGINGAATGSGAPAYASSSDAAQTPVPSSSTQLYEEQQSYDYATAQAVKITTHLHNRGLKLGQWSDVTVYLGQNGYMLHRLMLAQSPVLEDMMHHMQGPVLVLNPPDANVTEEALYYVISSFYTPPSHDTLHSGNARNILAAAVFLGVESIVQHATQICVETIQRLSQPDEIASWVAFVDAPIPTPAQSGMPSPALSMSASDLAADPSIISSTSNGHTTPGSGSANHTPSLSTSSLPDVHRLRYGGLALHLREVLVHHLVSRLPQAHAAFAVPPRASTPAGTVAGPVSAPANREGANVLMHIYSRLPFALFKSIVESDQLQASDMDRFAFAKRCVAERKRMGVSADAEETVVLAFGQGGQNVMVVRKPKRGRQLWKAGVAANGGSGGGHAPSVSR